MEQHLMLMKMMNQILFEPNELICVSPDPYGTSADGVSSNSVGQFFSINPLLNIDRNPTSEKHNHNIPRRADCNVARYRNILVEFDEMPLEDQEKWVKYIRMPFSTQVFSGNKSYHYIISLETPCRNEAEYRTLVEMVYKAAGGKGVVDMANSNPSRLSRFPGFIRNGVEQKLLYVGERVDKKRLKAWIFSRIGRPKIEKSAEIRARTEGEPISIDHFSGGTRLFLEGHYNEEPGWLNRLFGVCCDIARHGFTVDEAYPLLLAVEGYLDKEAENAIKNAFRAAEL